MCYLDMKISKINKSVCRCLVRLIKGHNINVQIKSALAVQALTNHNDASQAIFLKFDTPKALIRLLKVSSKCFAFVLLLVALVA